MCVHHPALKKKSQTFSIFGFFLKRNKTLQIQLKPYPHPHVLLPDPIPLSPSSPPISVIWNWYCIYPPPCMFCTFITFTYPLTKYKYIWFIFLRHPFWCVCLVHSCKLLYVFPLYEHNTIFLFSIDGQLVSTFLYQ